MDALLSITKMLLESALYSFTLEFDPDGNIHPIISKVMELQDFMTSTKFSVLPGDEKQALIECAHQTAHKLGNFMSKFAEHCVSRKQSFGNDDLVKDWKKTQDLIIRMVETYDFSKNTEDQLKLNSQREADIFHCNLESIKNIENMLLETEDSTNSITLNEEQSQALFLKKAFPTKTNLQGRHSSLSFLQFLYELCKELDELPHLICKESEGQPLTLLLIGGLLSFKPMVYDTWNKVKEDLVKIKESNNHVTTNHMWHIFTYCYNDLPYFLQRCFLYVACYPIGYEIPTTSLTEIWFAEEFVKEGDEESTAHKYLEELVQRSLFCVVKRSLLGTIKSFRVHRSIHEFAIQQSYKERFLVVNPDQEEIKSLFRLAIREDNKKQYMEVKNNHIHSFFAFSLDTNVLLGDAILLRVLELRKCIIPVTALPHMIFLRYLGLRGSNISNLPENIGDMVNLQTLDVRDTSIQTVPESLWKIFTLRHVYVNPSPQIKGPPSSASISNLRILKTVVAHESWQEKFPNFLIQLRKLALSNSENLDWKSISDLLSHMDKLISMAIVSDIIPSEAVDIRAFRNLETVKSIKLEGIWNCRKLPIDNIKFPPNLTKLTLTNSGLKEDPMPTLERLEALKFLSLQDGAYTGTQMVCSTEGFPQLQFLELTKLENLENWELKWRAMPRLTTLRIVQCQKLNNLPDLYHVTDKLIDN
ncbi:putative disease resistance protein At1g59780 [Carex rostrata]